MRRRDGPISLRVVAAAAKTHVSLCLIGGLLLSACTTTQPRQEQIEATAPEPAPVPLPVIAKTPVAPLPPTAAKAAKAAEASAPPAREPADQEPDPASNVFFPLGSAEIPAEAQATIQRVADLLKDHRRKTAVLVGGTDGLGSRELCIALSAKRTDAVEAELLKLGVRASQIRKSPMGCEEASRQPCDAEACRHKRRRVEIRYSE